MSYAVVEREIGGKHFRFESGKVAKQAAGACWVRMDDNVVLAAANAGPIRPGFNFFPMMVDYREKRGAAGKFPGGFKKREGPPSVKETLTMRLIDRPIRPLWPEGYMEDIQIQNIVLSADSKTDSDMVAINASSAALVVSDLPFLGPVGGVRVGRVDGNMVINPNIDELDLSDLNVVVVGTKDAITMVEAGAAEVSEADMLEALEFGHEHVKMLCAMQEELREKAGKPKKEWTPKDGENPLADLKGEIREKYADLMREKLLTVGKQERAQALKDARADVIAEYVPNIEDDDAEDRVKAVKAAWQDLKDSTVRSMILDGQRVDGRSLDEVRPIEIDMDVLPLPHGSCIFTRGETQTVITVTLGTKRDEQIVDGLLEEYSERFMLHYQFPPFCVGEVKPIRGPGRREIGHGALAQRALEAVFPTDDVFPYTVRVNSDITESNGSSSMASVCGGCVGMMAAGVPLRAAVAGVAMGLVMEGDRHAILTDILGDEDHYGDMDFKVAGTRDGITALQMDMKIAGISTDLMSEAMNQAHAARLHILDCMDEAISEPRAEVSRTAPRVERIQIERENIGTLIGPGGKTIRGLQEETSCQIDVEEDGVVLVYAPNGDSLERCASMVRALGCNPEVGELFNAKVTSVKDFGAFVELVPGREALCHVSELSDGYVDRVDDFVQVGDRVRVKVIFIDDTGRIKVSRKAVLLDEGATDGGGSREGGGGDRPRRSEGGRDRGRDGGRDGGRGRGRGRDGDRGRGRRDGGGGDRRPRGPRRD